MKNNTRTIRNLNNVINALVNDINKEFMIESLEWIRDRAILNLQFPSNLYMPNNYYGTNVTDSWEITINGNSAILRNTYENSASIEFGIGVAGQNSPHPNANDSGYRYNVPSNSKDENGAWSFKDQLGELHIDFQGYKSKSFLWKAFCDYKDNEIYNVIYQSVFDKIMKKVIKL